MIVLADGSEIPCRTVIIASGARYQRLAVDDLERFEGAGVYYAATDLEARICSGQPCIVVGGGNSAGQAAIYLAQQGSRVSIAIRGTDLTHSMSHYLIERIEADPRIELLTSHRSARARRRRTPRHRDARAHADRRAPRPSSAPGSSASSAPTPRPRGSHGALELDDEGLRPHRPLAPELRHERRRVRGAGPAAARDVDSRGLRRR